nr:hypothetical protein [Bacillus pumilus]
MVLKTPHSFEINDKAHADLFNNMMKILIENDTELLEQFNLHVRDSIPHVSGTEKKKWNESQLYKMTSDNGSQLINIPAGGSIYNEIKSLGACSLRFWSNRFSCCWGRCIKRISACRSK